MTVSLEKRYDETFAMKLVQEYLDLSHQDAKAQINPNDPPDLSVCFNDGTSWGIEVVRAYQKVRSIGVSGGIESSESVIRSLERIGKEIGASTSDFRKRDYSLFLWSHSALNPWSKIAQRQPIEVWKKDTIKRISEHIASDATDALRGSGFHLTPGAPGTRWFVSFATGPHEVASTLGNAIRTQFFSKTKALASWKVDCSQRWLLILNCYELADDVAAVEQIRSMLSDQGQDGFDGVFWSGCSNRGLVAVQRPQ